MHVPPVLVEPIMTPVLWADVAHQDGGGMGKWKERHDPPPRKITTSRSSLSPSLTRSFAALRGFVSFDRNNVHLNVSGAIRTPGYRG
ncbi:unnamed protein product [Calypogeia fissa]